MADEGSAARDARELIERCLAGERAAIDEFQAQYAALIYSYPIRVYRLPPDDAGDFYVFAFDNGRIFRRIRTFAGRTTLRAYLAGFVLDHLVLEWKRGVHEIETVSIDSLRELADPQGGGPPPGPGTSLNDILAPIETSKAVMLKLLFIEDCDLQAEDLRQLGAISGRPLGDLLTAIDQLRERVREREARQKGLEDALDGVQAWIALYERRLRQIVEALGGHPTDDVRTARLRSERTELERKLVRRHQQRASLVTRSQHRKVTAPYKDIAALLNMTVGTVASQLSRLRKELSTHPALRDHLALLGSGDDR